MSSLPSSVPTIPPYIATGRFSANDDKNKSGPIWIMTLLCLVYSTLMLLIRVYLRHKSYDVDDCLLFAATVVQYGQVAASIVALRHGLGQSHLLLTPEHISGTGTATFTAVVLFIVSNALAKLSVVFLITRIFNLRGPQSTLDSRTKYLLSLCFATATIITLWGVCSVIGLAVNCSISDFLSEEAVHKCPQQVLKWDIIGLFDILTEFLLLILSFIIVWPVRLELYMKGTIVSAFSFRLICALLSGFHIHYVKVFVESISSPNPPSDPGLVIVPAIILMQSQLYWSLASATIPNIKAFIRSFNTGLGVDSEFVNKYYISSRSRSRSNNNSARRDTDAVNETDLTYELSALNSYASPGTGTAKATTLQPQQASLQNNNNMPRRPSRQDVDLEGTGLQAGNPAAPGFGAAPWPATLLYSTTPNPESIASSSPTMGSYHVHEGEGSTPVYETDANEVMIRSEGGRNSRECIIRKEV